MQEKPTKLHIAPCIVDNCPHKDTLVQKIRDKSGIDVVEGGHPFAPSDIFA
jgi:predicted metal-binding protein